MIRQAVLQYIHEENALDQLKEVIGNRSAVLIHGRQAYEAAAFALPALPRLLFEGHCTDQQVEVFKQACAPHDVILALGGGSVIDTAKQVAYQLQLPIIVIPTIVSNCAPWTPLSVMYNEEGQYIRFDTFPVVIEALLLDHRIIAASPYDYFVAGLVDTLAKWYEARVLSGSSAEDPVIETALRTAERCKELILSTAVTQERFRAYPVDIQYLVETVIPLAGSIGGFGDAATRGAVGHAVHNALSPHPETHAFLHGSKVGYGLLIQEKMLGHDAAYKELRDYLIVHEQPTSLADFGLQAAVAEALAVRTEKEELCQLMRPVVTSERLLEAIVRNETRVPASS
ncbi:iron-containing alcohol dehydrogenase family protein [Exiguobacterium sp. TDN 0502]|uniref:iron-containing alcohol dehydrogenase family protein n=1 Tax=Exiguobacterium sp. TDN 0502 TaxID=3420731 RepID=UPI003D76F658